MRTYHGLLPLCLIATATARPAIAGEMTQQQAIEVATAATIGDCPQDSPCTFRAREDGSLWYVLVTFTIRNSPAQTPMPYPGGKRHAEAVWS
jgi:hypothetical protein